MAFITNRKLHVSAYSDHHIICNSYSKKDVKTWWWPLQAETCSFLPVTIPSFSHIFIVVFLAEFTSPYSSLTSTFLNLASCGGSKIFWKSRAPLHMCLTTAYFCLHRCDTVECGRQLHRRYAATRLHGVTSHKIEIFTVTTQTTSRRTWCRGMHLQ